VGALGRWGLAAGLITYCSVSSSNPMMEGPSAESEEKREPASDIYTAVVCAPDCLLSSRLTRPDTAVTRKRSSQAFERAASLKRYRRQPAKPSPVEPECQEKWS
jgi:hypothetical protein